MQGTKTAEHHHPGTAAREGAGHLRAEDPGRASDDGDLSREGEEILRRSLFQRSPPYVLPTGSLWNP